MGAANFLGAVVESVVAILAVAGSMTATALMLLSEEQRVCEEVK